MSILSKLFNAYPMLTQPLPDGLRAPVTDGSGRYMEAGVALKCLVYPIDADPATQHLVGLRLNRGEQAPSAPTTPLQTLLFDSEKQATQQPLFPPTTQAAPKTEAIPTPTATILEAEESPSAPDLEADFPVQQVQDSVETAPDEAQDEIPAVSMAPFIAQAVEQVQNIHWADKVTEVNGPGESPLADAYDHIEYKSLLSFVVHIAPPSTANTGIYSESSLGGAYQCYGAVVIGSGTPDNSLMPSASTGPTLRAKLFDLEDGTPAMFHVMHRVEVVSAIRRTQLFTSFADSVSSAQQDRVNARVEAAKAAEDDKLGQLLSDPNTVKALFAKLLQQAESN